LNTFLYVHSFYVCPEYFPHAFIVKYISLQWLLSIPIYTSLYIHAMIQACERQRMCAIHFFVFLKLNFLFGPS
jgi:hypothetical protein